MAKADGADIPRKKLKELFDDEAINVLDPKWYADAGRELLGRMARGEITPLAHTQARNALQEVCVENLHCTLADASRQQGSVFDRTTKNILDTLPTDVKLLIHEYERTDLLTEEVKKKCLSLLRSLLSLQQQARKDTIKAWLYVMRDSEGDALPEQQDSEGNGIFHPEWFHVAFFMAWTQDKLPKVLVMAPPGHGKTTCLRWYLADKIGRQPHRRFLGLYDVEDKPKAEIPLVATILETGRYRAIFPHIRLLDRKHGQERSTKRFTVERKNIFSREPTYEGYSVRAQFNGRGYDELICDDMCPPSVREQQYIRDEVWSNFTSVGTERLRNPRTAQIKMIATPWSEDDAHGRIRSMVAKGQLDGWLVLADCFAIQDDTEGRAIPLWSRFHTRILEQKKAFMGVRYDCNYRLQASTDATRVLRRMWYYNADPAGVHTTPRDLEILEALAGGERWLSVDPSATQAKWSSDNGVTRWVFSPGGYLFCTNVWFLHLGAVPMQDWLIRKLYHAPGSGYTGLYIEAQGGMKGQCNLWVQAITDALKTGQIPAGDGDDRQVVGLAPYARTMPRLQMTGTRMGGSVQNLGKMRRFMECTHFLENAWVRFAGVRVPDNTRPTDRQTITRCMPKNNSTMERFQNGMFQFDGTNNSDAIDSLSQFLLGMKHLMRNPNVKDAKTEKEAWVDPMTKLFRNALGQMKTQMTEHDERGTENEEMTFAKRAWAAA